MAAVSLHFANIEACLNMVVASDAYSMLDIVYPVTLSSNWRIYVQYSTLISLTILVLDYILTFDDEVSFIFPLVIECLANLPINIE